MELLFIRFATKSEIKNIKARRKAYKSISDKEGYEKVYKQYNKYGILTEAFYYQKLTVKDK